RAAPSGGRAVAGRRPVARGARYGLARAPAARRDARRRAGRVAHTARVALMLYLLRKSLHQPGHALRHLAVRLRSATSWEQLYAAMPEPKRRGAVVIDEDVAARVRDQLAGAGIAVESRSVEPARYHAWLAQADYRRYP